MPAYFPIWCATRLGVARLCSAQEFGGAGHGWCLATMRSASASISCGSSSSSAARRLSCSFNSTSTRSWRPHVSGQRRLSSSIPARQSVCAAWRTNATRATSASASARVTASEKAEELRRQFATVSSLMPAYMAAARRVLPARMAASKRVQRSSLNLLGRPHDRQAVPHPGASGQPRGWHDGGVPASLMPNSREMARLERDRSRVAALMAASRQATQRVGGTRASYVGTEVSHF